MEHLKDVVHRTPLTTSTSINERTGKQVYFKMENMQKTGAFKVRGASFKVSQLTNEEAKRGVIAASAGNHAQGVALAASKRGIKAKIFMPEGTPQAKVRATESYGAEIVLTGESFQESFEAACEDQRQNGSVFIHPFDDYDVMAGQGTIALEMLEQNPSLDTLIVPIGGGGLISGVAVAAKSVKPSIKIIGVQSRGASAMYNQYYKQGPSTLKSVSTIADGIAVKKPGENTFPLIKKYVDEIVTVSETHIADAIVTMLERNKSLVEGAGASALAALLAHGSHIHSNQTGIIVSGGNMDLARLPMIQELSQQPEPSPVPNAHKSSPFVAS
ncbi:MULTISPECIES: threonine ammonia-lyase [Pontibacillus]|uniref:L-threonine dehydratase catabolic TdcB n=1 Tax=Pontibacillus chungwhensis TaxID=265426 RepID=A0ABY8V0V2_9BACI|nr:MULTISPECIES: threonine ammonia-lyase [Pontibacillus]MCD5322280.1 threonine ammonia-lyase [Pontibacillus sp. HN14]WIF99572.1 threonine ammonia-lyase [Pontibacillus chungwhensis]